MKILMVTRENHPDVNYGSDKRYGLNKSLVPLINELQQRNIEVSYLSQTDAGERSIIFLRSLHTFLVKIFARFFVETQLSPLLWGILERLNMGRLAAKVMARDKYTHVHCHDPFIAAGYRWFARLRWFAQLRRGHTARWGVTEHGFGSYTRALHEDGVHLSTRITRYLLRWETKILLKAHWVITPTRSGLTQLERDLAIYPMPNTWHAIYHPRPILNTYAKNEARKQLGWSQEDLYIIAVGRFVALKNFSILIRACAHFQNSRLKLVFIGEGNQEILQAVAKEYHLLNPLIFYVSDDMGLYYSAADIYVSTSLIESFGMANLEAVVMGLPSVCTAVGGVPEVLGSGAYLIPTNNESVLTNALKNLIDDVNFRYYWSQQARYWTHCLPTVEEIADAYLSVYQGNFSSPVHISTKKLSIESTDFPFTHWYKQIAQWQACPLPKSLNLPENAKILIIAPHSDDETFGCGGTMALLQQKKCVIKVIIVTDGKQGDPFNYAYGDVVNCRRHESITALKLLGIDNIEFLNEPDGYFQSNPQIIKQLTDSIDNFNPDWLFIPSVLDYHRDHIGIGLSLVQIWQQRLYRERLFLYEIWEPVPATWVVDISSVFDLKKQAMQCYQLPLQYGKYDVAIASIMRYRSFYLSRQSPEYAEAFLELMPNSWQSVLSHLLKLRQYQEEFFQSLPD